MHNPRNFWRAMLFMFAVNHVMAYIELRNLNLIRKHKPCGSTEFLCTQCAAFSRVHQKDLKAIIRMTISSKETQTDSLTKYKSELVPIWRDLNDRLYEAPYDKETPGLTCCMFPTNISNRVSQLHSHSDEAFPFESTSRRRRNVVL